MISQFSTINLSQDSYITSAKASLAQYEVIEKKEGFKIDSRIKRKRKLQEE